MRCTKRIAITAVLIGFTFGPALSQEQIKLSGLFYMDYEYVATSPDSSEDGLHGFRYRRLYLTADYTISEKFSGRARLEAQSSRLTAGRPFTFVKDLWLKWTGLLGGGQDLIVGVQSPPSFTISEKQWGYRSLARTLMDRSAVVASRDFGVQLRGSFVEDGPLGYAVMLGNNSGIRGEVDNLKRVYGQLSWVPNERVTITAGTDYAAGTQENALNVNAFVSYEAPAFRIGLEGFYRFIDDEADEDNRSPRGISAWTVVKTGKETEVVVRADRVERDGDSSSETYALIGFAFLPHEQVRLIPNVWFSDFEGQDLAVVGRMTIHADF